jgi:hypothetical protein
LGAGLDRPEVEFGPALSLASLAGIQANDAIKLLILISGGAERRASPVTSPDKRAHFGAAA